MGGAPKEPKRVVHWAAAESTKEEEVAMEAASLTLTSLLAMHVVLATFPNAILRVSATLNEGAQTHSPNEWKSQAVEYHIEHALAHITGDKDYDHAATRLLMALECLSRRIH